MASVGQGNAFITCRLSGFLLFTSWRHNVPVKKTVGFVETYNGVPFTIDVGFILNNNDRLYASTFSNKMDAQTIYLRLKILYPKLLVVSLNSLDELGLNQPHIVVMYACHPRYSEFLEEMSGFSRQIYFK